MDWSQDEIAKVKDYLAEGLSAAQIGRALGRSRSGVLGLISRKGLRNGRSAILTPRRVPRRPSGAPPRSPKAKPAALPAPLTDIEPIGPIGVSAGRHCCQYIHGDVATPDWRMCGHPGFPWCDHHRACVFQKPQAAA